MYISAYLEFAPEGYTVRAFRYLLKRDMERMLPSCLDAVLAEHSRECRTLPIRQGRRETEVPLRSVLLIWRATCAKSMSMVRRSHKPLCSYYGKLTDLPASLQEDGFLRVGRSFVVNMRYIRQISSYKVDAPERRGTGRQPERLCSHPGALIWSGKGSLAMSYELKMKLLMHLVCIAQWGVFALIHWEMLGKGKWKHPFACTALALCGMLVISLWIDFGFFNAASIAFNVLYLLVTSAFFGGTIRQKLMSCMANGVVCLLTENTVIYLYTYLEAVPPAQVIRQPLGVLLMAAAMLIVGGITAQMAKHWGQKQALEPLQLVVAMFFPGVVVVLNMLLMVSGGRFDATQFSVLFTVGLTVAVLVHLLFVQMLNEQVVQKKDSQYRATLEQERAEALMESYTTQRRLTDEFANHLEALSLMLQQNDVAGARGYLTSISKTIQMNSAILNTHNPLLDALLSKKYEEAARKGVMMYFDLSDLKDIPLDRTHLVIVVSNLLNNAIEAAAQAAPPEVHVRMKKTEGELVISVRNRVRQNVEIPEGQLPRSTKREPGHGMGLANVCAVLEAHDAEYTLSCRDNWFRFTCAFPTNGI